MASTAPSPAPASADSPEDTEVPMRPLRPSTLTALLVWAALAACGAPAADDDFAGADDDDGPGESDETDAPDTDAPDTDGTDTDVPDTDGPPDDTDCPVDCPDDTVDLDANPLTGACGCEYACTFQTSDDAYDDAFTDSNCDGGDGLVDACVYVSATLGSEGGAGTRADPLATIAAALVVAEANAVPFVCLSGEAYEEMFSVPDGVTLVGSFDHLDPDFRFRRKAGVTTTVNDTPLP